MIKILVKYNPLENTYQEHECSYKASFTVYDYVVAKDNPSRTVDPKILDKIDELLADDIIKILVNKQYVPNEELRVKTLNNNDEIMITVVPKFWAFVFPIIVSLVLTGISIGLQYLLMEKPRPPVMENNSELPESPTYNWDGPATSYAMGRPIPLIYGKHGTGGTLINALTEGIPYGTEGAWRRITTIGRGKELEQYTRSAAGFWGVRGLPEEQNYDTINYSTHEQTYISKKRYVDWFIDPDREPTGDGFFISHIHDSPFPKGKDISTLTHYKYGPQEKPLFATKFKGYAYYTYQYPVPGNTLHNMYAWKRYRRYLTYDFTKPSHEKRARILSTTLTPQIPDASNAYTLGWEVDATSYELLPIYYAADQHFVLETVAGQHIPHFDGTAIDFPILEATQEQVDLYQIPTGVGTRIYSEYWYEGLFITNTRFVDDYTGIYKIEATYGVINGALLNIDPDQVQVFSFGADAGSKAEEEKFYSTANGLRMTIALSDGEICSVGRAPVEVRQDYEGPPQFKEYSSIFFNDIPIEKLYAIPTVEGYGTPLDIDATKGGTYPQIKNAPRDYSNTNLLTKRLTSTTSFDFLVGNPSVLEGQSLEYTTTSVCSSIEITLVFKQGLYRYDKEKGEFLDSSISLYIHYYPEGSDDEESARYWTDQGAKKERLPFEYNNKKTEPHTIILKMGTSFQPLPIGKYTITLTRDDTPQRGADTFNAFWVTKISEFNFDFLRYPNTAIMGMRILPSDVLQGSQPKINTVVEGRFIKVPLVRVEGKVVPIELCFTEYDEITEAYSWKYMHDNLDAELSVIETGLQYTSNPAFIVYDLLTTQELYPYITEETLVWSDFIYASEFCWEKVGTQTLSGNKERRFRCNIVIDGSIDASTLLNQLCAIYRFKLTWVGDKLRLIILKAESPVQRFTDADIIEGSYNESYNDLSKVPNTLDISYYDETNKYKQEVVQVTRKDSEAEKGKIVKQGYSLIGTTTASQAKRISNYLLASFEINTKLISFKTSLRGLVSIPGNVIRIETASIPYVHSGYIRTDGTVNNIYLNKQITIPSSNYGDYSVEIQSSVSGSAYTTATGELPTITLPTGDSHTFDCIGSGTCCSCGNPHTLSAPLTVAPTQFDTWQIIPVSGGTVYSHDYRVEEIKTDLDKHECMISCSPYNPVVYSEDPFWYTRIYTPPGPVDPEKYPPDVENLTLFQLDQTDPTVKVSYTIPGPTTQQIFKAEIKSVVENKVCDHALPGAPSGYDYCDLGCVSASHFLVSPCPYGQTECGTCNYVSSSTSGAVSYYNIEFTKRMSGLNKSRTPYKLYNSSGGLKGHVDVLSSNIVSTDAAVIKNKIKDSTNHTPYSLEVGDTISRATDVKFLPVDRVDIYLSYDGKNFSLHGTDNSKGIGYLISLPSTAVGKRIWVKAQAVSKTGIRSLYPPTETIVIGGTWCLEAPAHLSICGEDDGTMYFTGCDIDICWTKVSGLKGAGRGIEAEAGETQAGAGTDHTIVGYYVMLYENDFAKFLQQYDVAVEKFSLSHEANIDLHSGSTQLLSQYGQRALQFRVYQVDEAGNESCEPAELSIENEAPSMAGYTPNVIGGNAFAVIDWSSFITNPELYSSDIKGYQIWYGTSTADMTYVVISDPAVYSYRINGLDSGVYSIYMVPMDCFGPGSPRASYRSNIVEVDVRGLLVGPFPPPDPEGFTGSLEILGVTTGASYTILVDGLESFGFDMDIQDPTAYANGDYTEDYFYYNTHNEIDGYCYVTASDLNPSIQVNHIYYSPEASGWYIDVDPPSSSVLATHDYTVEDGKPKVGQKCSVNLWAELGYEAGGGSIFGGGLGVNVVAHARWRQPNPNETTINRLANFQFDIFGEDGHHTRAYSKQVSHASGAYGEYYEESIDHIRRSEEIDVHCTINSNTGDFSTRPILANNVRVNASILSLADAIYTIKWDAVTNEEGRDLQVVIQDWEDHWQDGRIQRFEVYSALAYWDFVGGTWQATHPTFPDILNGEYTLGAYQEEEYNDGNLRLGTHVTGGTYYCFVGATDGPIFHWVNEAANSSDGGPCTNWNQSLDSCSIACSGFELGNCPYGYATYPETGLNIECCSYASSPTFDSSRTVNGVSYNRYQVALGLRLVTGELIFVQDSETSKYIKDTTLDLIDSMHIKNAAITTAKIGDACINNAKIRNLSAGKVWIGDYAANEGWKPYTQHCAWDGGDRCLNAEHAAAGWTEDNAEAAIPIGAYKTGMCPRGEVSGNGIYTCNYTDSLFALERIFAIYGQAPDDMPNNDFTYINGGMILTNTIRARSLQIGAIPYVVDMDIYRVRDVSESDILGYVQIVWHQPGVPGANGRVSFPGQSGNSFNVSDGEQYFYLGLGELPSGDPNDRRRTYIGYIEDYVNLPDPATMVFEQVDNTDVTTWFTSYKSNGRLPLCAVLIVNHPSSGALSIGAEVDPQHILNSDEGQGLKVQIVMCTANTGTYITNNDITTGIIHNEIYTSVLDLRHYTGYVNGANMVGHGRLTIDAPSMVYPYATTDSYGDTIGKDWWQYMTSYPNSYGTDTKLLIGRPYVDGLETTFTSPSLTKQTVENLCDTGYLWFYRVYNDDPGVERWMGNLEVGGSLRLKLPEEDFELSVGKKYVSEGIREYHPTLNIYDTSLAYGDEGFRLAALGRDTLSFTGGITLNNVTGYFDAPVSASSNATLVIDKQSGVFHIDSNYGLNHDYSALIVPPNSELNGASEHRGSVGLSIQGREGGGQSKIYAGMMINTKAKYGLKIASDYVDESPDIGIYISNQSEGVVGLQIDPADGILGDDYIPIRLGATPLDGASPNVSHATTGDIISTDTDLWWCGGGNNNWKRVTGKTYESIKPCYFSGTGAYFLTLTINGGASVACVGAIPTFSIPLLMNVYGSSESINFGWSIGTDTFAWTNTSSGTPAAGQIVVLTFLHLYDELGPGGGPFPSAITAPAF